MFRAMHVYHASCAREPFSIPECRDSVYRYLNALLELRKMFRAGRTLKKQKKEPFHVRPKTHATQHLGEEKLEAFGSPRSSWCYLDEDFIGFMKSIASKTKHPRTLEVRIMQKLRILSAIKK
jgi:hypothetical protein